MAPPSGEQIQHAVSDLKALAGDWDNASREMNKVVEMVAELRLSRIEAGIFQTVVSANNGAVQKISDRCTEATKEMKKIGDAVRKVATTYEQEEKAGVHRIKKIY